MVINEWKDIPVKLLLRIISLVDDQTVILASGVCTGWRAAICLGLTHLSLGWVKNEMNKLVLSLAPKFTNLQTLVLRQDKAQLEDSAVKAIASHYHDLQDLDLSKSFKLTDHSLYALAHGCPNLTKLNISGCSSFSDEAVAYLTSFCRELKILNLCGCVKAASDKALQAIGRNCGKLQSLNLGWCDNVCDKGVMSFAYGCPDLRVLDLCGCVLITDESVVALANRCPHLTSLGLYYCQNITDRAMYSLAAQSSRVRDRGAGGYLQKDEEEGLRSLNISHCMALTPSAVQAVCDSFPALHTCPGRHSLIISGCLNLTSVHCACAFHPHRIRTVESIKGNFKMVISEWKDIPMKLLLRIISLVDDQTVILASGVCTGWRTAICFGLTHLSLGWVKHEMNKLVLSLAPKFTNLQTLVLRQDKAQLEDSAVKAIASHCHDLQDLDLSKSFKLTDHSLYALAHGCPNLTKLNISGCSSFSDEAVAYLTSFCRELKILNLCGCVKAASDKALQAIGRNCGKLQSLNLGWCDNVGDKGVMSLAYGCPDLRVLDLCGCVLITDESVVALANGCPHLTSLGLYYCQNITDRAMYSLAAQSSRVRDRGGGGYLQKDEEEGLRSLNISHCMALTPAAVQAVCDSFPALHTCPGRHSLIISGCLNLTSVHCACAFHPHSTLTRLAL